MTIPIPRFTGRSFERDGGWTFEFMVSMLGDEGGDLYGCNKVYPTKEEAIKHLKIAIQDAIKILSEEFPEMNIKTDEYIDMKTNATRHWSGNDEH